LTLYTKMQFCSECHNMYYLKIQDEDGNIGNTLIYYCRNCGHEDTTLSTTNICVSDIQLRSSEKKYTHIVNEYTKYDPTLPRINTIKCPNQDCQSNKHSGGIHSGGADPKAKSETSAIKSAAKKAEKSAIKAHKSAAQAQASLAIAEANLEAILEQEDQQTQAQPDDETNKREVIYIRYDDTNMKYVYLCVHCDMTWRTDNRL
jgi:DNA-directed RNA polymerase subunit M/transcription elongation factor TFIIS